MGWSFLQQDSVPRMGRVLGMGDGTLFDAFDTGCCALRDVEDSRNLERGEDCKWVDCLFYAQEDAPIVSRGMCHFIKDKSGGKRGILQNWEGSDASNLVPKS